MGTREPTADELRLVEIFNNALLTQPQHGGADACALHLVRAIIDGIRPMTERQWEDLPGLGKPWRDLSSREVWECFLESLSPKIIPDPPAPPPPPPEYPEPGKVRQCTCGHFPHGVAKPSEIINAAHAATADLGDDNAFAGEVRELKERGRDRRNGDRRIFEATCLTANKRNLNREDRRQGERRKP